MSFGLRSSWSDKEWGEFRYRRSSCTGRRKKPAFYIEPWKKGLLPNIAGIVNIVRKNQFRSYLSAGCIIAILIFLATPVMGAMSTPMISRDLVGKNMEGINHLNTFTGSAQECADLCDNTPGCTGATYVLPEPQESQGRCWRKETVTSDVVESCCISFVKVILPISGGGCSGIGSHADFTKDYGTVYKNNQGLVPLTVSFTDKSTGAASWTWDFGDASPISLEKNPVHTYTKGSAEGTEAKITLTIWGTCPGDVSIREDYLYIYDNVGFLEVTSTPAGAQLTLDGTVLGKTFTASHEQKPLAEGSHTLLLTLDGYSDYVETFTINNGQLLKISPVLETITYSPASSMPYPGQFPVTNLPETAPNGLDKALTGTPAAASPVPAAPADTGSLSVQSTPPGATVWLDGEKAGTTPVRVPGIVPGTHRLVLTLQGYNDMTQPVEITGGAEKEVQVSFPAKKVTGFAAPLSLAALVLVLLGLTGRRKGW
jgi:PKD repeat protein